MNYLLNREILPILHGSTPLEPLRGLSASLHWPKDSIWIKRDDLLFEGIGGNKARKLEYELAEKKNNGVQELVTFGAWGSNHVLITALCAKKFGFKLTAHLTPQPLTPDVEKKLKLLKELNVTCIFHSNFLSLALAIITNKKKPGYIHPGASSPLGSLGYVKAAFEFYEQIKLQIPLHKTVHIFVPTGSLGTVAGLLAGFSLIHHSFKIKVHAVQVVPIYWNFGNLGVLYLTYKIFKKLGLENKKRLPLLISSIKMLAWHPLSYLPQYGQAKPEVLKSMALLNSLDQISLDETYSGKAFHELLKFVHTQANQHECIVFWNTYPKII